MSFHVLAPPAIKNVMNTFILKTSEVNHFLWEDIEKLRKKTIEGTEWRRVALLNNNRAETASSKSPLCTYYSIFISLSISLSLLLTLSVALLHAHSLSQDKFNSVSTCSLREPCWLCIDEQLNVARRRSLMFNKKFFSAVNTIYACFGRLCGVR